MTAQSPDTTQPPTEGPAVPSPVPSPAAPPAAPPAIASAVARFGDALRDYARRVWVSSGEDDIFFLAGGIAFNILLAAVPFVLLVITGLVFALGLSPDASLGEVRAIINRFLPPQAPAANAAIERLLSDVIRARDALGAWGAVTFIWFSTRLFGSLRTVLAEIFDIESVRGIVAGKLFDVRVTIYASLLFVAYAALSTYLALASSRGATLLVASGLREDVMGSVEYAVGRLVAFLFFVSIFWALYRYLPNRRIRWQQALVGALSTSLLFEIARNLWTAFTRQFNPGSIYSGTIYAMVSLVFWVYYSALIFIIGGEVAQAHELRRVRRRQKETLG